MFEKLMNHYEDELKAEIEDFCLSDELNWDNEDEWHNIIFNTNPKFIYSNDGRDFLDWYDGLDVLNELVEWERDEFGESYLLKKEHLYHEDLANLAWYIIGKIAMDTYGNEMITKYLKKEEASNVV